MNSGSFLLYFSETVNISSVRCSDISISQRQYCNNSYTLSDCLIDTSNASYDSLDVGTAGDSPGGYGNATKWNTTYFYSTTLYFYFTLSDLNNLKSLRIAADLTSSYLHYKRATVLDQSDLPLLEINCTSPGLSPMGGFVPDNTRPSLISFTLSLTTGLLNLNFSETVDGSRLTENELTLVNGRDNTSSLFQYYTLSQVSHPTNLSPYLTINISIYDLNKIKEREDVLSLPFTSVNSFSVSLEPSTVSEKFRLRSPVVRERVNEMRDGLVLSGTNPPIGERPGLVQFISRRGRSLWSRTVARL